MPRAVTEDDIRRIYRETFDTLYAFIARRCDGDRELSEDVIQETWLRAVRAWHADGVPDNPAGWLTTVSRNLLANHYRRRPAETLDDAIPSAPIEEPDDRVPMLRRALSRLPLPQLRLLEAFHFERRPVAEIAAANGLSERAVEGRLRRTRERLRKDIESDTSDPRGSS